MRKNAIELIGTFFLVTAVGFSGEPLAIGLMLAVMVYCGGHISGAHYNPAVTLAVFLREKISLDTALRYWVSQFIGAILAGLFHYAIFGEAFAPAPGDGVGFGSAVLIEGIATMALALVVLNVSIAKKMSGNHIYGLAIGFTVTALASCFGDISGGAFNPAVALGPMMVDVFSGGISMSNAVIYFVGPIIGGFLAATIYGYTNKE